MNLRLDRGIRQMDLARACGLTPSALSRIESGKHQPSGQAALAIARQLGVTAEYLLDDSQPYPRPPPEKPQEIGNGMVRVRLTPEEKAHLKALRAGRKTDWEVAREIVYAPMEVHVLIHFLVLGGLVPGKKKARRRRKRSSSPEPCSS